MAEPTRDKDKSAKWLIEHHGDAILRLGGVTDLVRWQAAQAELVLPAKLPDGLLLAWRAGHDRPEPYVVEIATYPEQRAAEQALRDLLLVYLIRGEAPSVLVLVLRPKGLIDQHVPAAEHESLITVTQVFTRLRYNDPNLLSIFGGKTAMFEVLERG